MFGSAGLLLWAITRVVIPWLTARTTVEPVLLWFAAAGFGLFVPLLVVAFLMLRQERALGQSSLWRERLRYRPPDRVDWLWCLGGMLVIGVVTGGTIAVLKPLMGADGPQPEFLRMEPLRGERLWILAAWFPFFCVNILGEEFLWRGVVLPRQEVALGSWAWAANGLGWLLFHASWGWPMLVLLVPTTLVLPFVASRRRNTWPGVILHAALNGPSFLALSLGGT
ncbi:MAG: CPBP family intramembrane metalloprotease [Pirellulales bacterium]|nr:CPBP family intramembrane metalloprotease [Pirellulales bacterium]